MLGLKLGRSSLGKTVVAERQFCVGAEVLVFGGDVLFVDAVDEGYVSDHCLQIGESTYLGPSGELDDFVNHSCDPNTGIKERGGCFVLVALRMIVPGEEITFDYATSVSDGWEMQCACESVQCRGTVGNFLLLPAVVQARYIELGVVMAHVMAPLRILENPQDIYNIAKIR